MIRIYGCQVYRPCDPASTAGKSCSYADVVPLRFGDYGLTTANHFCMLVYTCKSEVERVAEHRDLRALGRKIVAKRQSIGDGWDQKTLAEVSGVNAGYLSMIERGLKAPSIGTLHKLRKALSLTDDVFLAWLDLLEPVDTPDREDVA